MQVDQRSIQFVKNQFNVDHLFGKPLHIENDGQTDKYLLEVNPRMQTKICQDKTVAIAISDLHSAIKLRSIFSKLF